MKLALLGSALLWPVAVLTAQTTATIVNLSDRHSKLFWRVSVTHPVGQTVSSGSYVMGEPWLALPPGHSASLTYVGLWETPPGGSSAGTEDLAWPGPRNLTTQLVPIPVPDLRNGTVVNPLGGGTLDVNGNVARRKLGYDARVNRNAPNFDVNLYVPVRNPGFAGLPLSVNDAVVSTRSNDETYCNNCAGAFRWTDIFAVENGDPCTSPPPPSGPSCSECPTKFAGVMSVLGAAPPAQAFRKPCAMTPTQRGTYPHFTVSQIRWDFLPRLAWPSNAVGCQPTSGPPNPFNCYPRPDMFLPFFNGVWLDHVTGESAEELVNPSMHIPGYGQYTKRVVHTAACLAAMNPDGIAAAAPSTAAPADQDFVKMVQGMLQAGIDIHGLMLDETHSFEGSGGKTGGRKFLVAFAGRMFSAGQHPGVPPAGMDGEYGPQSPVQASLPGVTAPPTSAPPRWCVWRFSAANGWRPHARFQEDRQFYRAENPLESDPQSRPTWEWSGSPWMYCSETTDRFYQNTPLSTWPSLPNGDPRSPAGPEPKRYNSLPAYTPLGIALRLLRMEDRWANRGLWEFLHPSQSSNHLHPMFGYLDRMMVPAHAGAATDYAALSTTLQHRLVQEWNKNNPFRQNPELAENLWGAYRGAPRLAPWQLASGVSSAEVPTGWEMRPNDFELNEPVNGCTQFISPSLFCQFRPVRGQSILLELHAQQQYLNPVPGGSAFACALFAANPNSGVPFTLPGFVNTVTQFLDSSTAAFAFQNVNTFGYLGYVMPLPATLAIGSEFAIQYLFADVSGSQCVAASNALVLRVQ